MKRRIGKPQTPDGLQYEFFELMQRHVLHQGDKSLATLSKESGWSRQTWHKALRGPELPNRDLVKALMEHLFREPGEEEARRVAVREALAAWTAAVAERTFGSRVDRVEPSPGSNAAAQPALGDIKPPPTADVPDREVRSMVRQPLAPWRPENFDWNAGKQRRNLPEEARLFALIRNYHVRAGSPPMRWISERMPEEYPVTRSTLNGWLNGNSLPTYGDRLLKALEVMRQFRPDPDLDPDEDAADLSAIDEALTAAWHARPR
ncbi:MULTISPECIES: hypothetical protein [unclassified Streptomyces]|uniref:hypothetical protein n=1 Tax=unclassified Streptomyces TaxID=2593676 RepID=UPI0038029571